MHECVPHPFCSQTVLSSCLATWCTSYVMIFNIGLYIASKRSTGRYMYKTCIVKESLTFS